MKKYSGLFWAVMLVLSVGTAGAATYTVTSSGDTLTSGTLRWAIDSANANAGMDTIAFDLGGPRFIAPTGELPTVTGEVLIDGTTQAGYSDTPLVTLDGGGTLSCGLELTGASNIVKALRITHWTDDGIYLVRATNCHIELCHVMSNEFRGIHLYDSPNNWIGHDQYNARNVISSNGYEGIYIYHEHSTNNRVCGNYLGLTPDGAAVQGNGQGGVTVAASRDNIIGSTNALGRNVACGNLYGIYLYYTSERCLVLGNYAGVRPDGVTAMANTSVGIYVGGPGHMIGGIGSGARNVVSGNDNYGIVLAHTNTIGCRIEGNYIGVDATGTQAVPNENGIWADGAVRNTIGGTNAGAGNVVSGNNYEGIYLQDGANENVIVGNLVGLDATGLVGLSNQTWGIRISTMSNQVGGLTASARNVIAGNEVGGIWIEGTNAFGNYMRGNYVGPDISGTNGVGNDSYGIMISGHHNMIGGTNEAARNVISGNRSGYGVSLSGTTASSNSVLNNYIGLDVSGAYAIPNYTGLGFGGAGNQVGCLGAGNYISGNIRDGVSFGSSAIGMNYLQVNRIGLDASGTTVVSNGNRGINIDGSSYCWIGGTNSGEGNVVVGSGSYGLRIYRSNTCHNVICGNWIGTDESGSAGMGNQYGVSIDGAISNELGRAEAGNVISGNRGDGIQILGDARMNAIVGNIVGLDPTGTTPLGNEGNGIDITAGMDNQVGGVLDYSGNIVSGNEDNGITLSGTGVASNMVIGNIIGCTIYTNPAGNGRHGISLQDGANGNVVGSSSTILGNRVAYNQGVGILVVSSTTYSNLLLRNSIYYNEDLGIDLGLDGETANDYQDPDVGANLLQNYPVITSVSNHSDELTIIGTFNSWPNRMFHVEFFGNQMADLSGYGEGEKFIGEINDLVTDSNGDAPFTNVIATPYPPPNFVTATAADTDTHNTSEFSPWIMLDTDGDGMGDGYEFIYFGGETNAEPDGDLDGDGVSNLGEFIADTYPDNASSCLGFARIDHSATGNLLYVENTSMERVYDLQYLWGTNLAVYSGWSGLIWRRQGNAGTLAMEDNTNLAMRVYRVKTEFP